MLTARRTSARGGGKGYLAMNVFTEVVDDIYNPD